jgi:hypothetical protein
MSDEKVIQIAADGGEVYGLTEEGNLVYLDKNLCKFVLKCTAEILGEDRATALKRPPKAVLLAMPEGRYREPVTAPQTPSRIKTMLEPLGITMTLVGIITVAIFLYLFVAR